MKENHMAGSMLIPHHAYDVPLEALERYRPWAEFWQPFGPHSPGFSRLSLLRFAREVLKESGDLSCWETDELCDHVFAQVAERASHGLFVLQVLGRHVQGVVVLVPATHLSTFRELLERTRVRVHT